MHVEWSTLILVALAVVPAVAGTLLYGLLRVTTPAPPPPPRADPWTPGGVRSLNGRALIVAQLEATAMDEHVHGRPALAYHLAFCGQGCPRLYALAEGESLTFDLLEQLEKMQTRPRSTRRLVCACGLEFTEGEDLRHHQAECYGKEQHA